MSTESIGGGLTAAEVAAITSSGEWTTIEVSPEAQAEFAQRIREREQERVRALMAHPFFGWFHRTLKTELYREYRAGLRVE